MLVFVIMACFLALYFLVREKTEIIEKIAEDPNEEDRASQDIRKTLLKRYLRESKNITLRTYQQLTGVSLEKAVKELEQFAEEGFLRSFGVEGQTIYYDPQSPYHKDEINSQINRRI